MTLHPARIVAGLAVGAALALGGSTGAFASSSTGAYVTNLDNACYDYGYVTVCETLHESSNQVATPSGNYIYTDNARYSYSVYAGGQLQFSDSGSAHNQSLYTTSQQAYQESHSAFLDTETIPGYGSCTYGERYHYANGQIQFDQPTFSCS